MHLYDYDVEFSCLLNVNIHSRIYMFYSTLSQRKLRRLGKARKDRVLGKANKDKDAPEIAKKTQRRAAKACKEGSPTSKGGCTASPTRRPTSNPSTSPSVSPSSKPTRAPTRSPSTTVCVCLLTYLISSISIHTNTSSFLFKSFPYANTKANTFSIIKSVPFSFEGTICIAVERGKLIS